MESRGQGNIYTKTFLMDHNFNVKTGLGSNSPSITHIYLHLPGMWDNQCGLCKSMVQLTGKRNISKIPTVPHGYILRVSSAKLPMLSISEAEHNRSPVSP